MQSPFIVYPLTACLPTTVAIWLAWPALGPTGCATMVLLAIATAVASGWAGLRTARRQRAIGAIAARLQRMANGRCILQQRFAASAAPELGRSLDQFLARVQATIAEATRAAEIDKVLRILDDVACKTSHLALDAAAKAARADASGHDFATIADRMLLVADRCWQSARQNPVRRATALARTSARD